ncbi:MAG: MBL fold metallo-hydrolase [Candidatus Heimdallarchaeota archaeon]|nr:MBL fold metallo-hydrolase [Candidatus Heimdallarchaeota archaeon]MBY8994116.1 MBL fold metallo-hydrolase [Candidatus Heimdallarchaeota archaeon]
MDLSVAFHGAIGQTTGSAHIIQAGNKRILLDCGMIQGLPYHYNRKFTFDPKNIDHIVLSHGHIDHSGRIPLLYHQGYQGSVYCTPATKDLLKILLLDAVKIAKEEARKASKQKQRGFIEPLYDEEDVYETLKHIITVPYHKNKTIEKNISFKYLDAGHILGSAQPVLDFDGTKIAFTGDLGQNDIPLIKNPDPIEETHYLITESTYGNRIHPPTSKARDMLIDYVKHVSQEGGKLIVPSFAIGRTQILIYFLNDIFEKGIVDKTPVYIDSPMAIDATKIYLNHPECFDKETMKLLKSGDNPLMFPELRFSKSGRESRDILSGWETCVVFAGSGMCNGGRILSHLINELPMKKSVILFVGYQAKKTLGRKIVEGAKEVEIYNKKIPVKAKVKMIRGFSAHADRIELKAHIERIKKKPLKTFVVHGDAEQSLTFAAELRNILKIWARVPEYRQEYKLRSVG